VFRRPRLFAIAPYTIGLLVVVLVLVGALAYKGYEAERSRRTTAEATLRDYAKFGRRIIQAKNMPPTQMRAASKCRA
jgi:Tfp pilus assembly protein PilE